MNLKPYFTYVRVGLFAAATFAAVLGVSWIAGQCRQWRTPPAPKPLPPIVDPGTPTAGPSSQAPTIKDSLIVARPDLTRKELEAYAKKYGLELVPVVERRQLDASADVLSAKDTPIADEKPPATFPMLLAEESFKHAPSGADVDVSAWLSGFGERVDLRAQWREWTPPTPAKIPVCQSGGFFRNESKWEKEFGAGALITPDGIGPGGYGSVVYRGFSTGSANWGARGMVAAGQVGGEMTGFGLVSAKVSW